jgi:hypothetical protein
LEILQIELFLTLLRDSRQVGSECRFGDRLSIVVIVLLALDEWLHIDRRNDPRFNARLSKRPANEMGAEASFHADDAPGRLLNCRDKCQSLDLLVHHKMTFGVKCHDVECVFPDIDVNRHQLV